MYWFLYDRYFRLERVKMSQRTISILQTHPYKRVQKNMLNAWNFVENKLRHRRFDNLYKIFPAYFFENTNGQILLIVALMACLCSLCLDN